MHYLDLIFQRRVLGIQRARANLLSTYADLRAGALRLQNFSNQTKTKDVAFSERDGKGRNKSEGTNDDESVESFDSGSSLEHTKASRPAASSLAYTRASMLNFCVFLDFWQRELAGHRCDCFLPVSFVHSVM